ncbi:ribonuclease E inhibitor RraB [Shewanella sp. TC10]|uniref:ribonuclease E inhibitor RraB n=1 Tax=Shewanella sp. TC10 TaxID=1419739 RepID=UPI001892A874|nr:ribonuclease E inhibitor RraB [Shewanella sp. TC10]
MRKFLASLLAILGLGTVVASELTPNIDGNTKTINALIKAGSDPNKAHPLEHHFYCYSEECLNSLMTKGKLKGYLVANTGNNIHEGTKYWYGDLIKETVLDLKIINEENITMLKLANEFSADYDGWGTPVVK